MSELHAGTEVDGHSQDLSHFYMVIIKLRNTCHYSGCNLLRFSRGVSVSQSAEHGKCIPKFSENSLFISFKNLPLHV